jgi:hypothetical protein
MKLTGRIVDASVDFVTGTPKVTLAVNEKNDFLQGSRHPNRNPRTNRKNEITVVI